MKKLVVAGLIIAASVVASAGRDDNRQNQGGTAPDTSLPQLIERCRQLEQNPQIKEFKSEVLCRGFVTGWRLKETTTRQMNTVFSVSVDLSMKGDRYRLGTATSTIAGEPSAAQCNVYEELKYDYLPIAVRLNSCRELEDLARVGREAFCNERLKEAPSKGEGVATGRVHSTCGN